MKILAGTSCFLLSVALLGCAWTHNRGDPEAVKKLIQARIDESLEAARTKDTDRYMRLVPQDWVLHDEKGATVSREDLRHGVLEQWSIIERTTSLSEQVDRLDVSWNHRDTVDLAALGPTHARTHRFGSRRRRNHAEA